MADIITQVSNRLTLEWAVGDTFGLSIEREFAVLGRSLAVVRVHEALRRLKMIQRHVIVFSFAEQQLFRQLLLCCCTRFVEYVLDLRLPRPTHGDLSACIV